MVAVSNALERLGMSAGISQGDGAQSTNETSYGSEAGRPAAESQPSGLSTGTLVDHFRAVFQEQPQERTYRFLVDGEGEPQTITNADLDHRVRAIAATLGERVHAGERVLIVSPPGLDYVASFLACLYAGVVAVPVYPPNPTLLKRTLPRLLGVIADATPAIVLAPASMASMADELAKHAPALGSLPWQVIDDVDQSAADSWRRPAVTGDDTAFLQYTSGSTGCPKGVVLSHANLLHNLAGINQLFESSDSDSHGVIWLPPYHDMGLIGGLLQPAYAGFPMTFMSPLAFLKRPVRWLRAISEYGATIGGGPNFAYELCIAKVTEQERETLDLSSWRVAFTGAEPVRAETIDRFTQTFGACGFSRKAFYPCYGLAEGTLLVSGGARDSEPVLRALQSEAYRSNQAIGSTGEDHCRTVVGSGRAIPGQSIVIVDPELLTRLPDGSIGEIWVCGPSIALGYWGRPKESDEALSARLTDTGEGPFLRTGDLGFLDDGELFVTGRIKDLIIVAGENHYPQDIERSVEARQPVLRPGCAVAFEVDVDSDERLAIACEVSATAAKLDTDRVISLIRAGVAEDHGLQVHDVVLVKHGKIPKTSSGKLQRLACRENFLSGGLEAVASWSLSPDTAMAVVGPQPVPVDKPVAFASRSELEQRLGQELARRLNVPAASLDLGQPFAQYGLQSVDMVGIVGDLEQWLGRTLPATLLWEYPTVEALADFLSPGSTGESPSGAGSRPVDLRPSAEPVAIIGIGCRFPGGADTPQAFWESLCQGRDAVSEVPPDRWKAEDFLDQDPSAPGKTNTRWGGFIDGVDLFDPEFFGISPREAAQMDPQQRLLAEVAWESLEDAGVVNDQLAGSATGVFVGIATSDYGHLQLQDYNRIDAYTGTGNAFSIAANRLSYLFDLRGPSIAIDTACSSSLVAVYQACLSLAQGDCSMALAGGVNLVLSPALAINFSKARAMAPDGRCKAFDARADGYVRSEGAGMVVLKPLARALADGDSIYAVISGGAVNQDGRTNGLMAPNPHAQEAVLRAAYARANVRPDKVHYVEAHGTGTLLGDPIEARALSAVVAPGRDPALPCVIGSVKSNLGHLEAAAGIAGLIKVALMMRNRMVPPSLHYQQPNPHIPFQDLSLRVAGSLEPWPCQDGPAVAGVSAFGFGGTNAHLVVRERPPRVPAGGAGDGRAHLLAISARTEEALRDLATKYESRLAGPDGEVPLSDLCRAAAVRRVHHEHRLTCVASTSEELCEILGAFARHEDRAGMSSGSGRLGRHPRVAFVFAGQGPSWWPIGSDLITTEPVFRAALQECDTLLRRHTDWSLMEQLTMDPESSRLTDPAVGQPALCALQIALAAQWRSCGVEPAAVVGHSVGEIAAAHVCGALGLEDALCLALHRGRVIRSAVGGGRMAVATLSLAQAQKAVAGLGHGLVSVAASNGPTSTVFSGETAALRSLAADLEADGIFCRVLDSVDFASHSPQMDPLVDQLRQLLTGLQPRSATVPMISTVTGQLIDGAELGASYWATNLRHPVLFDAAVTTLVDSGYDAFVEIAPHPMLGAAITERIAAQGRDGAVVASLRREVPARESMLAELGQLHCAGYPVDWHRIHGPAVPMVPLPTYPWQRQRYWLADSHPESKPRVHHGHPMLETFVRSAAEPGAHHWSARVDLDGFPYLGDHRVAGTAVLPASLVLETALSASRQALGQGRAILEDVSLTRITTVDELAQEANLQLVLFPENAEAGSFQLFGRSGAQAAVGDWTQLARGRVRTVPGLIGDDGPVPETLEVVRGRCPQVLDRTAHYEALRDAGLQYGPSFQGVDSLWGGEREAVARLHDLAELTGDKDPYLIHPALLDSALQTLAAALDPQHRQAATTYVPVAVARFTLPVEGTVARWACAKIGGPEVGAGQPGADQNGDPAVSDQDGADEITGGRVVLFDDQGQWAGEIDGITLRRLDRAKTRDAVADSLLQIQWSVADDPTPAADSATDPATGWWLLLADSGTVCADLRARLAERGGRCVTVTPGERYRAISATRFEVRPTIPGDLTAVFERCAGAYQTPCAGVVGAWSLDASLPADSPPGAEQHGPESLWTAYDLCCIPVLHLVQSLALLASRQSPKLVLVTRGAQRVADDKAPTSVAQSALWGLATVICVEHGELRPTIIDLDPAGVADEVGALLEELLGAGHTEQIALRGGRRHTPSLEPWTAPAVAESSWQHRPFDAASDGNHRILAAHPGILDSLTSTLWERHLPGPGQVEIEVAAAGLNFMDVLKALDSCPGVPSGIVPLGAECAGRVSAVGAGVGRHKVGDRVMAVAPSSMAAFATTGWQLVAPLPEGLSDEQAAATPIAFLTAVYGLEYLARLRRGDTVLIHSATGGVGLAALQVAQRNGAEVFATAGTREKRELLASLGVKHVMDSRSLRFADEVMDLTQGRGVDVVLNSLTGQALTRSLSLLAPNGRFVEIGKQDIYHDGHLGLGLLRQNRSFFAVDLEQLLADQPDLVATLFAEVGAGFDCGELTALPVTGFTYPEAAKAFAYMAQARHTGKVVLRPEADPVIAVRPEDERIRSAATYLITGGLGALGLETARYLVDQGARHLALLGRHEPSAEAGQVIAELRSRDVEVAVFSADISRLGGLTPVLAQIDAAMPPLAGVVHAAGILDDGLLLALDHARFRKVARAKVAGAWNLHRATLERDLDFFVLFSSAAAILGSPGQGNYAAANAFMDSLAQQRHSLGLPALSINWGPWSAAGLAASPDRGGALSARGIISLSPQDGIAALGRLLPTSTAQAVVLPLDRHKLSGAAESGLLPGLLANLLVTGNTHPERNRASSAEVLQRLLAVEPGRRRVAILTRHCMAEAARVLKLDVSRLDPAAPLASMGFDSLMSLELRKRLEASLNLDLPATLAWRFPTIDALVPYLAGRMDVALVSGPGAGAGVVDAVKAVKAVKETADPGGPAVRSGGAAVDVPKADGVPTSLDQLPDIDVEALLLAKMTQIDEGHRA